MKDQKDTKTTDTSCCGPTCCTPDNFNPGQEKTAEELKKIVQEQYSKIAQNAEKEGTKAMGCCGTGTIDYAVFADDYKHLEGYNESADLGLGCGLPTEFAHIKAGDTVVDLGSGAGNDAFVARAETGDKGKVIGVDFTQDMLMQARKNTQTLGYNNVDFLYGDIENIPLPEATADVVVSNCVFNLVPDKEKAFIETKRILKEGGHFSISDVVVEGEIPKALQEEAELYAGCVSGAIQKSDYLDLIKKTGFKNITVQKQKPIPLPDSVLDKYLNKEQIQEFNKNIGIFSITVYAEA